MAIVAGVAPATHIVEEHHRPQLLRPQWTDLVGAWGFANDDDDVGRREEWFASAAPFDREIVVPFPPESRASRIGDRGFHPVLWYRRVLTRADLERAGHLTENRLLLHFGAVDFAADVWLEGSYLGRHVGGQGPFTMEATSGVQNGHDSWALVVRAEDDPWDAGQPRGKQDWQLQTHEIWYDRTSGIWQPVWIESVPSSYLSTLSWQPDVPQGRVGLTLELDRRPDLAASVTVSLQYEGEAVADTAFLQTDPRSTTVITIPRQANGQAYESLLWSPEQPRLISAYVTVEFSDGVIDRIWSYFGLRSVGFADGRFLLNDRPYYVRAALEQGYWPETHLAAPSTQALREEVQLAKDFGFNTVRIHQKVEDPRYLYWADRLGLMVWGECGSTYEFSVTAVERMTREWLDIVRRDFSHPCVVTWVPFNESWGVRHVSHDPAQLDYIRALFHLTKTVDPSRPVVSNDGWEHADSDVLTVHDYEADGSVLESRYRNRTAVADLLAGIGPAGRRMRLIDASDRGQPVIVSEFGGVSFTVAPVERSWGYSNAADEVEFEAKLRELFGALQSSSVLAGFCYTQLTDTMQETNGLADAARRPKLPTETIRSIVLGMSEPLRRPVDPPDVAERIADFADGRAQPERLLD
jgi:beta-galactosidase/beta-glucuronidase